MNASRACALSLSVVVLLAGTAAQAQGDAASRFARFDANHDGKVTKDEYGNDATFRAIDTNHDNRIDASEVQAILGPQRDGEPSAADRIRVADKNNDGVLTDEELRRGAETRFEYLDTNNDGNLDEAEFRAGFGVVVIHP